MVYSETLEQRDFRKTNYNYIVNIFDASGKRIYIDTSVFIYGTAPHTKFVYTREKVFFAKEFKLRTYDLNKQTVEVKDFNFTPVTVALNRKNEVLVGGKAGAVFLKSRDNKHDRAFLSNYTVSSILEDMSGNYWIATLEHGMFYIPDINFSSYNISEGNKSSIHLLKNIGGSKFVVSFHNGEAKLIDIQDQVSITGKIELAAEFGIGPILSTFKLKDGRILISHYNGTCIYDPATGLKQQVYKNGKIVGVYKNVLSYKDKLLLSNYRDVFISDPVTFKILDTASCADRINSVTYNQKLDKCYVGCLHGLYEYHGQKSIGKQDLVLGLRVEYLKSSENYIFIATKESGLIVTDGKRFDTITKDHGLISNICKTLEVEGNQIWISTNGGLSKITYDGFKKYSILNYSLSDILPTSTISNLTAYKGKLLFTLNGNLYTFPLDKRWSADKFYISSFSVNDKVKMLRKPLDLSYSENNIKIKYEALFYGNMGRNEYRYKLIGSSDSTWKYTNQTSIYLPSLSPGRYSIQLQARTPSGKWKSAERALHFNIKKPFWLRLGFLVLVFLFCLAIVILIYVFRYRYVVKRDKEKNRIQTRMYELETKAAKAQMNPHFIFNSLNSIQQFILEQDNEKAFFYLTRFSKLIRRLLESNRSETISLEEEMDLLKKYLEIESMRFDKAFNYKIVVADGLIPANIKIPHMMVQPFVENAIWHGLLHKTGDRNLEVSFSCVSNDMLRCVVDDDGVGRKPESERDKKGRKSLGIEFIKERLELMSKNYQKEFSITVIDKKDVGGKPLGTRVEITLPIIQY
jgi:hypothetical protein